MKKIILLVILINCLNVFSANAQFNILSYDFIQASYGYGKYTGMKNNGTSYYLIAKDSFYVGDVSKSLNENVFINAQYAYVNPSSIMVDGANSSVGPSDGALVNIGYRLPVGKETDFNIQLGHRFLQVTVNTIKEKSETSPITIQFRHKISPLNAEIESSLTWENYNLLWGGIGLGFSLNNSVEIFTSLLPSHTYTIGLRYKY